MAKSTIFFIYVHGQTMLSQASIFPCSRYSKSFHSRRQETSAGRRAIDLAAEADQRGSHGKLVMNFLQKSEEMGGIFQWPEGKELFLGWRTIRIQEKS